MDVGSFLNTGDVVIFTIKCLKIIIFDEDLSGGQQFLCVSGYIMGGILQDNCIKLQNPILMLTPMCQDTPCQISNMCDNVCNFNEFLNIYTNFRQRHIPKRGFLGPWDQTGPSWRWSLWTRYGPRYMLTGNHSEKKLAENIMRAGPGSRTINIIHQNTLITPLLKPYKTFLSVLFKNFFIEHVT